jgi:ubiquitin-conjugating enzyme E2 variant
MMTNQIHQWAHQPLPPRPVCVLQSWGLLLGRAEHEGHHRRPHDRRYCITTGWLNRPLDACDFFKHLERLITWSTGLQPRHDDRRFAAACAEVGPVRGSAHV